MSTNDHQQELESAIADYVAGDLSDSEAAALEQELQSRKDLQQEQLWWQQALPALKAHGRPQARVPDSAGMAAGITRRLEDSLQTAAAPAPQTASRLRFPEWLRYLGTAAAAAIIAVLAFQAGQTQSSAVRVIAYNEYGDAIIKPDLHPLDPHTGLYSGPHLPLQNIEHVDVKQLHRAAHHERIVRPYLGLLVKPITVDNSHHETGALILQVMGDSPAASLGIEPGDVILSLAECPLMTSHCMLNALKDKIPGDRISIIYLDRSSGTIEDRQITIGATYE